MSIGVEKLFTCNISRFDYAQNLNSVESNRLYDLIDHLKELTKYGIYVCTKASVLKILNETNK